MGNMIYLAEVKSEWNDLVKKIRWNTGFLTLKKDMFKTTCLLFSNQQVFLETWSFYETDTNHQACGHTMPRDLLVFFSLFFRCILLPFCLVVEKSNQKHPKNKILGQPTGTPERMKVLSDSIALLRSSQFDPTSFATVLAQTIPKTWPCAGRGALTGRCCKDAFWLRWTKGCGRLKNIRFNIFLRLSINQGRLRDLEIWSN